MVQSLWPKFGPGALLLFSLPLASLCKGPTAVEKVIELLQHLDKQVTEEGAKEAAEYDKYACFCKEKADHYQYAIEKSDDKITALVARIDKLTGEISTLDSEVIQLGTRIECIEVYVAAEEATRKAELDEFIVKEKNVTEAIEAVQAAIVALQDSKSKMSQGTKLNLQQIAALALVEMPAEGHRADVLTSLLAAPGDPASYTYKSNDIIATLQWLEKSFKENKMALWEEEHKVAAASAKKVLSLTNEKKFKEKSKTEKEELSAEKTKEKTQLEQDKAQETTDRAADVDVRGQLETACETKANEWDQRSASRASEITAIAQAIDMLKTSVAQNYEANKKLVGLATRNATVHPRLRGSSGAAGSAVARHVPVTLLQMERSHSQPVGVHKVLEALALAAEHLKSPSLAVLKAKVEMQEDHFVKVRALINDLISKLEAEAVSEADSKSFCDTEMGKEIQDRDTEKLNMEDQQSTIASKQSKMAQLQQEIADLSKEIAALQKDLAEITELRQNEKDENDKTRKEAGEGKIAVKQAIAVLEAYYSPGASLAQVRGPDRDGNYMSDMAPETSFSGDYSGKQDASKGILGLLNVILSDFERTDSTVEQQEADAVTKYNAYKSTTEGSIITKGTGVSTKQGEVSVLDGEMLDAKDALATAEGLHASALKELEKLKAMCIEGEESWAERKRKREQEVEALKDALKILEEWKS